VKAGEEQVAILYLVNPADDVLKSFKVCALAAHAPPPECGDGGETCCPGSHCSHGLICSDDNRCLPPPSLCGDAQQVCCAGNSCKQGLTCDANQCIELGQHFDRGMAAFALFHYDEAITEFEAGFREKPSSEYVYNIAVAHQLAGHKDQAVQYYLRYLELVPDAPNRDQVVSYLTTMGAVARPKPKPIHSDIPDDLAMPGDDKPSPTAPGPGTNPPSSTAPSTSPAPATGTPPASGASQRKAPASVGDDLAMPDSGTH
jgi:hypothetical protein